MRLNIKIIFTIQIILGFCFRLLQAQEVPLTLGMQTKNHSSSTVDLEDIKNIGAKYIRYGFIWESIEKQRGVYDFSRTDRLVSDAEERGLSILGTLFGGNMLYEADELGGIQTEAGRQGFAAFSAALAERYKDKNLIWEIWNEPNTLSFWRENPFPTHDSLAGEYTALVKETVPAMLAADPECFVMAGSVSAFWEPSYYWSDVCFKKGIGETGIRGWSVHPYGLKTPEEYTEGYDRFREIFAGNDMPDSFPIFNSERGFSLEKLDEGWSGGDVAKAEEYQAWHFVRQYMIDLMNDIRLSVWYEYDGQKFGIIYNGEKRKSYYACMNLVNELSGYTYKERLSTSSPEDYLLLFENAYGNRKVVAWTAPPPKKSPDDFIAHTVEIPIDLEDRASAHDIVGNRVYFEILNNRIRIELTGSPKYISYPRTGNNASLSSITWPDAPEIVLSQPGWKGDTIPAFNPGKLNYLVKLPDEVHKVPALFASPKDVNAKVKITAAKTIDGPSKDRTTAITVTAEDDTTQLNYYITFDKDNPIPAVWSYKYLVINDSLVIRGIHSGTTVDSFLSYLSSDSTNVKYSIISGEDGSEKTFSAFIDDQDILKVYTSDSIHLTGYILKVSASGLDNDAMLKSNSLRISVNGNEGNITGFSYETSIKSILDSIEVPEKATLQVLNNNNEPVSLRTLNYDNNYVPTLASDNIYFKVTAQDMQTEIVYQLVPDTGTNEIFVFSDLLNINQQARLISSIPRGMNVISFISRLWSNMDAYIRIIDHLGQERNMIEISSYYYLEVSAKDGSQRKKYYLEMKDETGIHAYVLSDFFTVNQELHEIYGLSDSISVETLLNSVVPAVNASVRVVTSEGFVKISGKIETESDQLKVISGTGKRTVVYELMYVPKYPVTFNVTDGNGPAVGAEIIIDGETLFSGLSGTAMVKLPNGTYEYSIEKENKVAEGTVTIEDSAVDINVAIKRLTYQLLINVTEGTDPVQNAIIVIDGKYYLTDASGQISLNLPNGEYAYTVSVSGYDDQTGLVVIEDSLKDLQINFGEVATKDKLLNEIRIYPNPSGSEFHIILPLEDEMSLKIYDIHGILLYSQSFEHSLNHTIELSQAETGLYILHIHTDKHIVIKKIIIQ